MVAAQVYLLYLVAVYLLNMVYPYENLSLARALIIVENAIYIYCMFSFLRFSTFISSEHSVLHDFKILTKTVTICFVATIVGY